MKLVGIMPVRNEDWCLGFTLRVALKWCDQLIVADHGCTDGSRAIMESLGRDGVIVRDDREDRWNEMQQRQMLLEEARSCGATHVALIDADEFITANLLGGIRGYLQMLSPGQLVELPGYNLRQDNTLPMRYHSNGVWGNRWFATAFPDSPGAHWGGDQFHHREPMGVAWRRWRPVAQGHGGTLHLWGASERRLRAKHALYRVTERIRWPEKPAAEIERYYNLATTPREPWKFKGVPPEWLETYQDLMPYLHIDAEPWQVSEVKRLVLEHGVQKFHGLDLLGVPEW